MWQVGDIGWIPAQLTTIKEKLPDLWYVLESNVSPFYRVVPVDKDRHLRGRMYACEECRKRLFELRAEANYCGMRLAINHIDKLIGDLRDRQRMLYHILDNVEVFRGATES